MDGTEVVRDKIHAKQHIGNRLEQDREQAEWQDKWTANTCKTRGREVVNKPDTSLHKHARAKQERRATEMNGSGTGKGWNMFWKSRSHPLLAPQFAPLSLPHSPTLLPNFLPCFPSFSLVICRRYSPYLAPCATSTRYCAVLHRHDSPSATLPSALYIQPMYLLYLVRFELVGHTPLCTSHTPSSLRAILHYCASVPWCCDRTAT